MSKEKRRVSLARFHLLVEDCGDGKYTVACEEFDWSISIGCDGEPDILEAPEPADLPSRLTNKVVVAAVKKFHQRYRYN